MPESNRHFLHVNNVRLCYVDFGGNGSSFLLLHGLAGRANEWHNTAQWLTQDGHVFALDQRGHGRSDKQLNDYSRDAYVKDVMNVIEQLHLAPVVLIGQSMGGQNAFLVAARYPYLVRALIVIEAAPDPAPSAQHMVAKWLNSWPLPFSSLADARAFFGGETLYARTWLEILEERDDGYWPQFGREEMIRSIDDSDHTRLLVRMGTYHLSYIDSWRREKFPISKPSSRNGEPYSSWSLCTDCKGWSRPTS